MCSSEHAMYRSHFHLGNGCDSCWEASGSGMRSGAHWAATLAPLAKEECDEEGLCNP